MKEELATFFTSPVVPWKPPTGPRGFQSSAGLTEVMSTRWCQGHWSTPSWGPPSSSPSCWETLMSPMLSSKVTSAWMMMMKTRDTLRLRMETWVQVWTLKISIWYIFFRTFNISGLKYLGIVIQVLDKYFQLDNGFRQSDAIISGYVRMSNI